MTSGSMVESENGADVNLLLAVICRSQLLVGDR